MSRRRRLRAGHEPEKTVLHEVVRAELVPLLVRTRSQGAPVARFVERVLPEAPIRQWVLTLPHPLRYRCAWDAKLTSALLRCFVRSVFADYRCRARGLVNIRKGQCGAATFIQLFCSALNRTAHVHTLVLDGVFPLTTTRRSPCRGSRRVLEGSIGRMCAR